MSKLPDQFDLCVRQAKRMMNTRPECILGVLFAQSQWYFYNQGDKQQPIPAQAEVDGIRHLVVFSSVEKLTDFVEDFTGKRAEAIPSISIPVEAAADYCLQWQKAGCEAILVNPGEFAFSVSLEAVGSFLVEWKQRASDCRGFWIPNMTSEEEDFWQQHGL